MDNIYNSLEQECRAAGTNLTQVCRKAGINRSTPQRWKQKEPNTIRLYRKLMAIIAEEAETNKKKTQAVVDDNA